MENKNLEFIRRADLDQALAQEYRQYLTGHLSREQKYLKHIDNDTEIGISFYQTFTPDKPHMHPLATEHGYVLQGSLRMRVLDGSNTELQFDAGDFFVLRPNVPYATKNAPNTKILFIKAPGINDKTLVQIDAETEEWLSKWD